MEEQKPSEKQELITEVVGFSIPKLWFTFKELTLRPGQTIAAYCDGSRSKYISPVTYCLLSYSLFFFFAKHDTGSSSTLPDAIVKNPAAFYMSPIPPDQVETFKSTLKSTVEFIDGTAGSLLIAVPVILLCQWLFFKKFRKPFLHHFYFILFVIAQINLLTIPIRLPIVFSALPTIWLIVRMAVEWAIALAIYFYGEFKFYPRITVKELAIRTAGFGVTFIIPWAVWYVSVFLATYFVNKFFFS